MNSYDSAEKDLDDDASSSGSSTEVSSDHDSEPNCPTFKGSFGDSARPIDFIDEEGNLPLTNVSSILPSVIEEDEEDIHECDESLLPTLSPCTQGKEEATLSTVGTESPPHTMRLYEREEEGNLYEEEDGKKMEAILAMKDALFKHRSALKRAERDKKYLRSKCSKYKREKKELLENKARTQKQLRKLKVKSDAMKTEMEKLQEELDLAKMELGRRNPVAAKDRKDSS